MKRSIVVLALAGVVVAALFALLQPSGEAPAQLPTTAKALHATRHAPRIELSTSATTLAERSIAPVVAAAEAAESRAEVEVPTIAPEPNESSIRVGARDAVTQVPVAEVLISLRAAGVEVEARTLSDGWAEAAWPRAGVEISVRMRAKGYATRSIEVRAPAELVVELYPLGTFAGVVVDRVTARPVADADLTLSALGLSGVSDAHGRFSIEGFTFGKPAIVSVTARGYATQLLHVDADPHGHSVLELTASRRLFGSVTDYESGRPVAGASIHAPGGRCVTGADGVFDLEVHNQPEVIEVTIAADGYCEATTNLRPAPAGADVRLPRTATVAGVVRNALGQPVGGARVQGLSHRVFGSKLGGMIRVNNDEGSTLPLPKGFRIHATQAAHQEVTGPDGRFTLANQLPSSTLSLDVHGEGIGTRIFKIEVGGPGSTTEIELFPGCPEESDHLAEVELLLWNR